MKAYSSLIANIILRFIKIAAKFDSGTWKKGKAKATGVVVLVISVPASIDHPSRVIGLGPPHTVVWGKADQLLNTVQIK